MSIVMLEMTLMVTPFITIRFRYYHLWYIPSELQKLLKKKQVTELENRQGHGKEIGTLALQYNIYITFFSIYFYKLLHFFSKKIEIYIRYHSFGSTVFNGLCTTWILNLRNQKKKIVTFKLYPVLKFVWVSQHSGNWKSRTAVSFDKVRKTKLLSSFRLF
jgi:hypothetical protein